MSLRGRSISLRPPTTDDAPILAAILAEPAVATWWGDFDLERVKADLLGGDAAPRGPRAAHPQGEGP